VRKYSSVLCEDDTELKKISAIMTVVLFERILADRCSTISWENGCHLLPLSESDLSRCQITCSYVIIVGAGD
jgi:hypothetical protein